NPPPTSLVAQWVEPYSMAIGLHAHAVAQDADATEVYRALYGSLAGEWVDRGFFEHRVYVVPGDRATEEAWVNLGFGRRLVCAMRPTSQPVLNVPAGHGIQVHQAGSEDIDLVMHLEHVNTVHHFRPPIFWPYLHETMAAARDYQSSMLADARNGAFIAYRDGRPLGMDTFTPPDWLSPLVLGGPTIYLFQGVVEEEARGGGVGKVLLDHAMRWAREQQHEWCALHFASANPSGAPFWLSQGFVPVEYTMGRRVDDRVAWARP
ncbi:MAG: GNAT family N-acetyltransferase, partial [Hyphomicrobiales bacterium]